MDETKAVTVRLQREVYQQAADVAALTGATFKELVSEGLRREVRARIESGGESLRDTLESMRGYREQS